MRPYSGHLTERYLLGDAVVEAGEGGAGLLEHAVLLTVRQPVQVPRHLAAMGADGAVQGRRHRLRHGRGQAAGVHPGHSVS